MNSTNAVVNFDLADACTIVALMAEDESYPVGSSIEQIREAIGRVATRLGDSFGWKAKLATARNVLAREISRAAQVNANRRAEESQRRLREAAERIEADRKFRHDRNLRHAKNRAVKAAENSKMSKGFGAGTSQPQGKQKGGKRH